MCVSFSILIHYVSFEASADKKYKHVLATKTASTAAFCGGTCAGEQDPSIVRDHTPSHCAHIRSDLELSFPRRAPCQLDATVPAIQVGSGIKASGLDMHHISMNDASADSLDSEFQVLAIDRLALALHHRRWWVDRP